MAYPIDVIDRQLEKRSLTLVTDLRGGQSDADRTVVGVS
jgi:hypothetical protein